MKHSTLQGKRHREPDHGAQRTDAAPRITPRESSDEVGEMIGRRDEMDDNERAANQRRENAIAPHRTEQSKLRSVWKQEQRDCSYRTETFPRFIQARIGDESSNVLSGWKNMDQRDRRRHEGESARAIHQPSDVRSRRSRSVAIENEREHVGTVLFASSAQGS